MVGRTGARVDIDDGGFALERGADGAEPDLDPAFVTGGTGPADQLEARHAGDELGNVLEEFPHAVGGLIDVERGLDVGHGGAAWVRGKGCAEPRGKG